MIRRGDAWIGVHLGDRYQILDEVGRGGRGVVYRALDPRLEREVAVKILPPSEVDGDSAERFQREARLVGQMDHPGIVPIHDFGRHDDTLFFVMPLLEGETLRQRLQQGTLAVGPTLEIASRVAAALDYSHERGVVHRDIKPENIMLERVSGSWGPDPSAEAPGRDEGSTTRVRVMDFGLARDDRSKRITRTGNLPGTLAYLSPEQVLSSTGVDGRSDLYSLGAVLYECLVGETPFDGPVFGVLYSIVHEVPRSPSDRGVAVPVEVERVLMACLAKDPADRPASGRELWDALRDAKIAASVASGAIPILAIDSTSSEISDTQVAGIDTAESEAEKVAEGAFADPPSYPPGTLSVPSPLTAQPLSSGSSSSQELLAGVVKGESTEDGSRHLAGRGAEMARIRERLEEASSGTAQLVLIAGEAGLGKSRILREIGNLGRRRGSVVLLGRGLARRIREPYQLFADALLDHFLADSGQPLPPDLAELLPDLFELFPRLAGVPSLLDLAASEIASADVLGDRVTEIEPEETLSTSAPPAFPGASGAAVVGAQWAVPELLGRVLTRLAAGKSLVLLLDGLHYDETSASAVGYLLRRLGSTSLLVVGTYRPSEVERGTAVARLAAELRGERFYLHMELGVLDEGDFAGLLSDLLGTDRVDPNIVSTLYEATEGNPLFAESLVESLVETGSLTRTPAGIFHLAADASRFRRALPSTLRQAAEARLDRLPEGARKVLEIASVIGRSFDFQDLEALWSALRRQEKKAEDSEGRRASGRRGGAEDLDDHVDRLVQRGALEEDLRRRGDRLSFVTAVLREQAYRRLSRRRRRSLHRLFAETIEARNRHRPERVYARLVHHFARADAGPETVRYGLALARRSLEDPLFGSHGATEAIEVAETALDLVDAEGVEHPARAEAELLALMARAHLELAESERAGKRATEAFELYEEVGDEKGVVEMLLLAAEAAWRDRRIDLARRWVDRGIRSARQSFGEQLASSPADPPDPPPGPGQSGLAGGEKSLHDLLVRLLDLGAILDNLRGEHTQARRWDEEARRLSRASASSPDRPPVPEGGILITTLPERVRALVPGNLAIDEEVEVAANIFETLLGTGEDGRLRPRLCREFRLDDGGRRLALELRDDVRFSDGEPLTAEDVVRSLTTSAEQGRDSLAPGFYGAIEGMSDYLAGRKSRVSGLAATSELGLEVRLARPLAVFPAMLSDHRTAIAKPAPEAPGGFVGTGPFRLLELDAGDDGGQGTARAGQVRLVPNSHARRPPRLAELCFRTGVPPVEGARLLRSGEIDLARDLAAADLEDLASDPAFAKGVREATRKNTWFVLVHRHGLLAREPLLRRTLAWVLVSHDLVWRTLGRFALPAMGLIPPGVFGHDPGRRRDHLGLADARHQLELEGLRGPFRLRAAVHPLLENRYGSFLRALLDRWAELGVEVEMVNEDRASFLASYRQDEGYDLMFNRWNPDYDDPDNFTFNLLHGQGGILGRWAGHAEADRWMEEARRSTDAEARLALYRKLEDWLAVRAWLIPLFHELDTRVASPRVRGVALRGTYPCVSYDRLGIEPRAEEASTRAKVEPQARTERAERGGKISAAVAAALPDLDPTRAVLSDRLEVTSSIFETLMRVDARARVVPHLLSAVSVDRTGCFYSLRLREGVRFHDGRRLSSRDVRFSFERLLRSGNPEVTWILSSVVGADLVIGGFTTELSGIELISATELRVELLRPSPFFPALLTHPSTAIVPEGAVDQDGPMTGSWRTGCAGTGPFRVAYFDPGNRVDLEAHPDYWRSSRPRADRLTFHLGLGVEEVAERFRDGRLSLAGDLTPEALESLRLDPELGAVYREAPRLASYFLVLQTRGGPFADIERRRALRAVVGHPALINAAVGRLGSPARGFLPPGVLGHVQQGVSRTNIGWQSESPELLWGLELRALLHPAYLGPYRRLWSTLVDTLAARGAHIRSEPVATTLDSRREESLPEFDLVALRWIADYPDTDAFITGLGYLRRRGLLQEEAVEELTQLGEQAAVEVDPSVRHALYRRLEEALARDVVLVPLFHEQIYRLSHAEVRGVRLGLSFPEVCYEDLWVDDGPSSGRISGRWPTAPDRE